MSFGIFGFPTDATIQISDVTTNNVTSSKHGFAPKSPADNTKFLDGGATPAWDYVRDSDLSLSDVATNNASTSNHGFLKKLDNSATNFMNGQGNWAVPAGGSNVVLMHTAQGSTPVGAEATADTYNVAASDFAVNDLILVICQGQGMVGENPNIKIRIADGTNTYTSANTWMTANAGLDMRHGIAYISQGQGTTTKLVNTAINLSTGAIQSVQEEATMITNWLSAALTITLRGNTSATGYFKWWIYKIKA